MLCFIIECSRKLYEIISKAFSKSTKKINNLNVVLSKAIDLSEVGSSLEAFCLHMWMILP
eukprot:snap_masked-scaffold_29-processed-gene-2.48-mRNA-1 protein AED:1.00 eAED:1.00 QI:0/0/0/0/1/1/2/0/59